MLESAGAALVREVVPDLAGAKDEARDAVRVRDVSIVDHDLEPVPGGEGVALADREPVPEQALRAHDDERLAVRPDHLAPEEMEDPGRGGRDADPEHESLEARRGWNTSSGGARPVPVPPTRPRMMPEWRASIRNIPKISNFEDKQKYLTHSKIHFAKYSMYT